MASFKIPFLSLAHQHASVRAELEAAISEVYNSNHFILGPKVTAFEQAFAHYSGVPYCIGVASGTDALTIALQSSNLQPDDEVIVQANTYFATWLSISKIGAKIVPVDPDETTFTLNTSALEQHITDRTKVILPVHLFGHPCDMTAIGTLARRFNLTVVEDNCQAHGAKWREKFTGSYGSINATSFYPTKNLGGLGDGGAITTFDEAKASFARQYRNYGSSEKDLFIRQGINSRLDELQAAALEVKLRYLDGWNEDRRLLATHYLKQLKDVGDIILPLSAKEAYHVYHLFVIRTGQRDKLRRYLADHGIDTMIHYPVPPHLQPAYKQLGYKRGDFPVTERMADTMLSLPLWIGMTEDQLREVTDTIRGFYNV